MGLRTPFALPSFKPLSRSSSPAPPPSSTGTSSHSPPPAADRGRKFDGTGLVRPDPKRSRSLSRPLSVLAISSVGSRSATPTPSPKNTPLPLPSASFAGAGAAGGAPGGGDASSYMEAVGYRLSEACSKALNGTAGAGDWKGRRGIARGNGKDVAMVVAREFPAPPIDLYVLRAIVRVSVKQLSVFSSRLEALLLPALIDPSFTHPILSTPLPPPSLLIPAHSSSTSNPLNPCQSYALSLAHTAFEARDIFTSLLAGGVGGTAIEAWPKFVHEGFQPIITKLDSIVGRVVQPLMATIKRELGETLGGLKSGVTLSKKAEPGTSKAVKAVGGNDVVPPCLAPFASRIELARRAMSKIAAGCGDAGEGWIVSVVASTVWKGMMAVAERPVLASGERSPGTGNSPRLLGRTLTDVVSAKLVAAAGTTSTSSNAAHPASTTSSKPLVSVKSASNVASLLSRPSASRPSSPPGGMHGAHATSTAGGGAAASGAGPTHAQDPTTYLTGAFASLAHKLVDGLVPYKLPASSDPGHLAREALAEALEALQSLRTVVATLGRPGAGLAAIKRGLEDLKRAQQQGGEDEEEDGVFLDALDDVPPVVLLHLFAGRFKAAVAAAGSGGEAGAGRKLVRTPCEVFGWTPEMYERTVLAGFGAAEEWERRVGAAVRGEVEGVLKAGNGSGLGEEERTWLEVLALVVDVI